MLHIVLIEPEIPQNTGNIGRTCVGIGATLHLVGKTGFSMADRDLKRAGLDYWPKLKLAQHADWAAFVKTVPAGADVTFLSTHGARPLWDKKFSTPCYLVFGSESRGLPPSLYKKHERELIRIPILPEIRSLNLSVAVGVAAFEAARQLGTNV